MIKKLFELLKIHSGKIIIISGLLLFLVIPVIVDRWIIGNDFPSNIENSDWVAFLGGYVGGIFSLIGIGFTILHTSREAHKDRVLACAPFLVMDIAKSTFVHDRKLFKLKGDGLYGNPAASEFNINISNQGNGTAISIQIFDMEADLCDGEKLVCSKVCDIIKSVSSKESITYGLSFDFIAKNKEIKDSKPYKYGTVRFKIKYFDLLHTEYFQAIKMEFFVERNEDSTYWRIVPKKIKFEYPQRIKCTN